MKTNEVLDLTKNIKVVLYFLSLAVELPLGVGVLEVQFGKRKSFK